jgi:hypothetical protein
MKTKNQITAEAIQIIDTFNYVFIDPEQMIVHVKLTSLYRVFNNRSLVKSINHLIQNKGYKLGLIQTFDFTD